MDRRLGRQFDYPAWARTERREQGILITMPQITVPPHLLKPMWKRIQTRCRKADNGCIEYRQNGCAVHLPTGTKASAHRIVYIIATKSVPPPDCWVLRTCGNRYCVNPKHLALGKPGCNSIRKYQHQKNNRYTKFTDEQIRQIRSQPESVTSAELARRHGISAVRMLAIRKRKSYKWVT